MRDRDDWDGRELSRGDSASSPSWEGGSRNWLPWVFSALIPIGLGLLWLSLRGDEPSPPSSDSAVGSEGPAPPRALPEGAADVENAVKLPQLSDSDPFLREILGRLSNHPVFRLGSRRRRPRSQDRGERRERGRGREPGEAAPLRPARAALRGDRAHGAHPGRSRGAPP